MIIQSGIPHFHLGSYITTDFLKRISLTSIFKEYNFFIVCYPTPGSPHPLSAETDIHILTTTFPTLCWQSWCCRVAQASSNDMVWWMTGLWHNKKREHSMMISDPVARPKTFTNTKTPHENLMCLCLVEARPSFSGSSSSIVPLLDGMQASRPVLLACTVISVFCSSSTCGWYWASRSSV